MAGGPIPGLQHVDHVALTVPDLDAAVRFYCDVLGGTELYRIGPFDADELPPADDGRDWTEAHINVKGGRLYLAMISIAPNVMLELFRYEKPEDASATPPRNCDIGGHHIAFKVDDLEAATAHLAANGCTVMAGPVTLDEGPSAGLRFNYVLDPWGNQLEFVEYTEQAFMAECKAPLYRR